MEPRDSCPLLDGVDAATLHPQHPARFCLPSRCGLSLKACREPPAGFPLPLPADVLATLWKTCVSRESALSDVGTTACPCMPHTQHLPARPPGLLRGLAPAGGSGFYFFNVSLSLCNY
ncbi:unnamed protein product [Rangifer tarandus platyrhynchus]|uniref:Uncharacterized protein n=2 Tax=Rangifer tarandus platyrhynchus TaxID=3082113 RepID=A0ABN8Y9F7_RANTA|nr:unnamed protein product [Rangifer tarandus platyrhynchus]